jgi:hypothetical protein
MAPKKPQIESQIAQTVAFAPRRLEIVDLGARNG